MATAAQNEDEANIQNLLNIYDKKILPIGIGTKGNTSEIVDIVSNYCWTAQQFDQRNTSANSVTYSHNIPFCYAIERQQTIGSGAANILNTILGGGAALAGVSTEAFSSLRQTLEASGYGIKPEDTSSTKQGKGTGTASTTATTSVTPATIRSNTFPNIIMPTPGNGQQQQSENDKGIATIDLYDNWRKKGEERQQKQVELVNRVRARLEGQEKVADESPQGQGTSDSSATSKGGTESKGSKESGTQSNDYAAMFKAFQASTNTILSALQTFGEDFAAKIEENGRLQESNLNKSEFLKPWRWLYFTKETGKKFVFPMLRANDLHKVSNQWGNGESTGKFAGIFDKVSELLKQGSEIAKGIRDFAYFFPAEGESRSYENLEIEKAMGYQYSTQGGPEAKIDFVLYNTTKKDSWKQNFRFILLFALRNMPFRTSIYAYKAPLLYDIIIPGVKHLPMCYVASFDITALGHVRNMTTDNIMAEIASTAASTTSLIPVPEAWQISITFKCMIPNTANLVLDLASFPINVTTYQSTLGSVLNDGRYSRRIGDPRVPAEQVNNQNSTFSVDPYAGYQNPLGIV